MTGRTDFPSDEIAQPANALAAPAAEPAIVAWPFEAAEKAPGRLLSLSGAVSGYRIVRPLNFRNNTQ